MTRYTLNETFVVHQYAIDQWEAEPHNHNYFEIIFIEKGNGYHTINGIRFPYKENDIFLLAPEDTHHFEIEKRTNFTYFKFTELLFSSKVNLPDRKYWLQRIEQLLHQPNIIPGDVISHEEDRNIIWDIHNVVLEEFKNEKVYYQEIISNAISTILSIIVRNIAEKYNSQQKNILVSHNKIDSILSHIRQNVYDNDLTKINFLANKFNMSQSSISTYFKRKTGESIHQYVTKYKMKLVEYRLQHTEFTIAEIAYQLGYTDESHLTKTFKKHFSMSPKQYRNEMSIS
ncbi:AraC family transcriptional regulator [Aquimarina sp. MAR_2010_214]|uniref:AraC family transcriptional regulator n=1 Tax=Aquimarina sp. MAR_2010_214 TaxID=1250026 RepID=UPI000C707641|nr:AraC family transcriptional regulator [Aquimarina sp. MAR_2010_214]PKV49946.1 AraC family transcriptional regulator [Aquimarina sp. MAR_2010_214]